MNKNGWIKLSKDAKPRRYRKEIFPIEAGWQKDGQQLPFNDQFADSVIAETTRKLANKVKTPLVLTHDGQEPYGQVVELEKSDNDRGGKSLFAVVDFENEEAEKKGLSNEVSVYIPPKSIDGNGRSYNRALEHLALTPYPVVHGMDKWQPLAASFTVNQGNKTMDLSKLAEKLGVTLVEGDDDASLNALLAGVDTAVAAGKKVDPAIEAALKKKAEGTPEEIKVPKLMLDEVTASRDVQLDQLVADGNIDAATRDSLSKKYCNEEHLTLALSKDTSDDFAFVVKTLKVNTPLKLSGSTEGDELSEEIKLALHGDRKKGEDSPVVAAAKATSKSQSA